MRANYLTPWFVAMLSVQTVDETCEYNVLTLKRMDFGLCMLLCLMSQSLNAPPNEVKLFFNCKDLGLCYPVSTHANILASVKMIR